METMLSVVTTLKQQHRNVLDDLTAACQAALCDEPGLGSHAITPMGGGLASAISILSRIEWEKITPKIPSAGLFLTGVEHRLKLFMDDAA